MTARKVFYLEAATSVINTFKGGINKTDRFGIQTRLKFNNTNSRRDIFEMKSMNLPSGSPTWPKLIVFDEFGKIKADKGNILDSYSADQWYDIVVDLYSPNHRYSLFPRRPMLKK